MSLRITEKAVKDLKINCIWEHNGGDTLLYSDNFIGAYTRGDTFECALAKMPDEVISYLKWRGKCTNSADDFSIEIVQEKISDLNIKDADSDVLFESETGTMTAEEYLYLKELAMKSARDFLRLYESIPDPDRSILSSRDTFYGARPRTAAEMYNHTKNVNAYYFGEIGIEADNDGDIAECRLRGFELLEQTAYFLENKLFSGSWGEDWTLKKLMRRFIWHDRIHARAMYRMAVNTFGEGAVENIFFFGR